MKYFLLSTIFLGVHFFGNSQGGKLQVNTNLFNNDNGKALLFLYRQADKIPGNPFKTITATIKDRKAIFEIQGLPFGEYAAILLHDENENGKIDHFMGIPSEQLGYSNNWALGFFTGMPDFPKLKFQFSSNATTQNINISYKKN